MEKLDKDERFFFEYSGYSYNPNHETPAQGRLRCAKQSVIAEQWARKAGYSFQWQEDTDIDSTEWRDDVPAYQTWNCTMFNAQGEIEASLYGIDFGPEGSPHSDHYKRVVESELAMEAAMEAAIAHSII